MSEKKIPASNTKECFRYCIGLQVIGVMFGNDGYTLVFDNGTGLTLNSTGAFWIEGRDAIDRMRGEHRQRLEHLTADLRDVLALSGEAAGQERT